jgi:hypothetical protein
MDLVDETKQIYQEFLDLNPRAIFIVSMIGLIFTLVFVIIFKERLLASYGERVYLWFLFLIGLNVVNIIFISWYYQKKYNNVVGPKGPSGDRGKIGIPGDNVSCSTCTSNEEIGIQYSDDYFMVGKINKTTNVLGSVGIWRAAGMLGLSTLGDTIFTQDNANKSRTYLAGFGAKQPVDFKKLIEISDGVSKVSIWEPIPPKDYSFVGHCAALGRKKPNPINFACLPTKCLVPSDNLLYVASFPSIDIIPSVSANRYLKFCSFWRTPLNHFYCKVSTNNYSTNSLYFNLVDGNPDYYDVAKATPKVQKYNEIIAMLKSKTSVIYHAPKVREKSFNTIYIENVRDDKGQVKNINIIGSKFNKILAGSFSFEGYLNFYHNSLEYVFKLKQTEPKKVVFIKDDKNTNLKNAFVGFEKQINDAFSVKPPNIDNAIRLVKNFQKNPALSFKPLQDAEGSFGVSPKLYSDMTLKERFASFESVINLLNLNELEILVNKLKAEVGEEELGDFSNTIKKQELYDILNSKKKSDIKNAYLNEEEVNPSLTLEDDLYYLFPRGLDDQIAANEDDAIESGYYLEDVENIQRKNFFDYIKTFIKPNVKTYSFRKKCMVYVDVDKERDETINNLLQVYDYVSQELDSSSRLCDNSDYISKYYTAMMKKVDNQFKSIDKYNDKIRDREFSYFPTSRLKWLLNEMNKYYAIIKTNCNSDDRVKTIGQIKTYRDQLKNDFNTSVDFNNYELNYKDSSLNVMDLNKVVAAADFDYLDTDKLKKLLEIVRDYYDAQVNASNEQLSKIKNPQDKYKKAVNM